MAMEKAILGGGCFWCIEAVYKDIEGVESAVSGYMGGDTENPSYEQVCTGRTGHAEVVQVTFDPDAISYGEILDIFFTIHDPTQRNRQGADVGTQYRSVIFTHSEGQKAEAARTIARAGALWDGDIVTEIAPAETFYRAEDYHQDYFEKDPGQPYCAAVVAPKVSKARKQWTHKLKSNAA